jgi:hypothetical protein
VLVPYDGQQSVIEVHGGMPVSLRRFRGTGDEAALAGATRALQPLHTVTEAPLAAAALLASASPRTWALSFDVAERAGSATSSTIQRGVAWVAGAALAAARIVLALEWRARSALDDIRAERASLALQLARTAPLRLRVERVRMLRALDTAHAPTVARRLATVSTALPDGSYLTRLRVNGDSTTLEGRAVRAGSVWRALNAAPALGTVASATPIRRETAVDGVPLDRFTFTLHGPGRP